MRFSWKQGDLKGTHAGWTILMGYCLLSECRRWADTTLRLERLLEGGDVFKQFMWGEGGISLAAMLIQQIMHLPDQHYHLCWVQKTQATVSSPGTAEDACFPGDGELMEENFKGHIFGVHLWWALPWCWEWLLSIFRMPGDLATQSRCASLHDLPEASLMVLHGCFPFSFTVTGYSQLVGMLTLERPVILPASEPVSLSNLS